MTLSPFAQEWKEKKEKKDYKLPRLVLSDIDEAQCSIYEFLFLHSIPIDEKDDKDDKDKRRILNKIILLCNKKVITSETLLLSIRYWNRELLYNEMLELLLSESIEKWEDRSIHDNLINTIYYNLMLER